MHVPDDRQVFAPRDGGGIGRRHLHVDGLKHAGAPARPVIPERLGGAPANGLWIRIRKHGGEAAVELLDVVADLGREPHQRPHDLAEHRGERSAMTGRHMRSITRSPIGMDLPAVPPARLEEHAQCRRDVLRRSADRA